MGADDIDWIRGGLEKPGKTQTGLAAALGRAPSAVTELLKGRRQLKASEIPVVAAYLGIDPPSAGTSEVHVMGYIGAGGEISPEDEQVPEEGLETIELPFSTGQDMIAFRVRGDSMYPAYQEDDAVIVYREQKRPITALYGSEAAVRTRDGRRYIKRIMRGPDAGTVNLESFNARTIEAQRLEWIGEVFAVVRSSQWRLVERNIAADARRKAARHKRETAGMDELPLDETS